MGRSRDSSSTKIGEKASKWSQVLGGGIVEILLISSIFTMNWILGDNSKFNQGVVPIIVFVSLLEQINKEIQVQSTQPLI